MRFHVIFMLACLLAAAAPFRLPPSAPAPNGAFPGWPTVFEGYPLRELPRTVREQRFERGFPGRIARFTDGHRELVIRWVTRETRMLHPATECFRGLGYRITPLPLSLDAQQRPWGAFIAERDTERLRIRELIDPVPAGSVPTIPEPEVWVLLVVAALVLLAAWWRRRRACASA